MLSKLFTDPLGSYIPALERNVLIFRGMQMLLVMFYAEELRRTVLDLIQTTDKLRTRLPKKAPPERVPTGTKNPVDKALNALIADCAITVAQKAEIVELIDYRNVIGHQMHTLFLDVSSERIARETVAYASSRLKKYDYRAVRRLQHFHRLFDGIHKTHSYARTLTYNRLVFRSAELTFLAEIKRLNRKCARLTEIRRARIESLNGELSLEESQFEGQWHPQHPLTRCDNGRLTKRGAEVCYRLFDLGKSTMAVAHLTGLSLIATRRRRKTWTRIGGADRAK